MQNSGGLGTRGERARSCRCKGLRRGSGLSARELGIGGSGRGKVMQAVGVRREGETMKRFER